MFAGGIGERQREYLKENERYGLKKTKRWKKRLTDVGEFDNMDKLSQGAETQDESEAKNIEKRWKKQLTNRAACDILKKLAKSGQDRKIENIENFIV